MSDEIDLMIDRVRGLRRGREPLYITCNKVFYEFAYEMSDEARTALEEMGRAAVATEEHPVEPVTGMEFPLPVVGFLAVTGETLRAEDGASD
ncbi:MAG TPA: hypothetical protein VFR44_07675 [Actinomycetota bacterium]|nr:hypothetical protein [Actinomycetota bacterium]